MGYSLPVASMIATRFLRDQTLFPNEAEAAAAVMASLPDRPTK